MSLLSVTKIIFLAVVLFVSGPSFGQIVFGNPNLERIDDSGPIGPLVNGIPNFQKTTESIYRGGRPSQQGLQWLKKSKFKTIINLENNKEAVAAELAYAKKIGIQMYSSPLSWTKPPNDKQINSIIAALKNPKMYPVFVHCHYGKDRTGLIIGLYRVFVQGWTPKDAYAEMLKIGFHPEYKALDDYWRAKTKMR